MSTNQQDVLTTEKNLRLRTLRKTVEHYARTEVGVAPESTVKELTEAADVLRAVEVIYDKPDIRQLMRFYSVDNLDDLIAMQARHVERLQAKLPPLRDERPGYVPREG